MFFIDRMVPLGPWDPTSILKKIKFPKRMVKKPAQNWSLSAQMLFHCFTIDDFANKSVWNLHTFMSVQIWELGIKDGMIFEKIFAVFTFKNLEKQAG